MPSRTLPKRCGCDPSDAGEAILNRCNILAYEGQFDAALADCQKGLQEHPDDPYAIGGLAFVYYKMGVRRQRP